MSPNLVTLLYLVASVCFIQALKGLSHPTTSVRGNVFGMVGMGIAVFTTAALIVSGSEGAPARDVTVVDNDVADQRPPGARRMQYGIIVRQARGVRLSGNRVSGATVRDLDVDPAALG